jgi:hypothetical protein
VISFLNENAANFSFQITNQLTNSTISSGGEIHSKGETGGSVEPTPYTSFQRYTDDQTILLYTRKPEMAKRI